MRERACDILDACRRVVKVLDGQPHETLRLTGPAILVAEELYPTDIVTLDRSLVLGFITSAGSPNAHAAIIARTMGIPAAVMAGPELLEGCDGRTLALNGDTGEAYLDPDEATKTRFAHKLRLQRRHTLSQERLRAAPCTTKDGTRISLMADCASVEDVRTAVEAGADGVGLLLSEYLLLAGRVNGEEEQYGFYAACLAAAQGRPVTICTFDVAPDKTGTEFPREEEANPAMGLCGVRYCLAHPDFFETQLRALLRAGLAGNLRILLPMVSTRDEFEHALDAVYRAKCALRERGVPFAETVPVGAFIETPAAALTAGDLARRAAFFNVGTNNLIQYTYAADRVNPQVRAYLPAALPRRIPACTVRRGGRGRSTHPAVPVRRGRGAARAGRGLCPPGRARLFPARAGAAGGKGVPDGRHAVTGRSAGDKRRMNFAGHGDTGVKRRQTAAFIQPGGPANWNRPGGTGDAFCMTGQEMGQ